MPYGGEQGSRSARGAKSEDRAASSPFENSVNPLGKTRHNLPHVGESALGCEIPSRKLNSNQPFPDPQPQIIVAVLQDAAGSR